MCGSKKVLELNLFIHRGNFIPYKRPIVNLYRAIALSPIQQQQ